jgi:hypothetical protein
MKGLGLLALLIPLIIVAGLTGFFINQNMNSTGGNVAVVTVTKTIFPSTSNATTSESAANLTTTAQNTATSGGSSSVMASSSSIQTCSPLASTNSTNGLLLRTYLQTNVTIGNQMCVQAVLENDNATTISSLSGNITVTDSQGGIAFQSTLTPFQAGSVKITTGSQLSFQFLWNTSNAYEGMTPQPGTYSVQVIVQFIGLRPVNYIESQVNCTLSAPAS